jgi:HlyD family secretion protein
VKRRLGVIVIWLAAAVAVAASLPSAGRLGRAMVSGSGAPAANAGGVPVAAVARRDFVHIVPAEGNLRAARSTPLLVPRSTSDFFRVAWMAPDGEVVHAGDVVVRFDPTEIEKTLADAAGDLSSAHLKADKQQASDRAEIAKLEQDAAVARNELENAKRFQKKDATVFSRNEIIQSEMDENLAGERERHAREVGRTRQDLARADLGLAAVDIRQAELKIRQARANLSALAVVAPHDGVLVYKRDYRGDLPRIGDQVYSGSALAEIPDLSVMQAEVYVLEADAGGLAAGRPATLTVESAPGIERAARIARVDSLAKPRLKGSPVQFFAVTLDLARTDPRRMKPGQRVAVLLRLAERRGALVVPRQAVFQRHGRNVVYRRQPGGAFAEVPVEVGPADLGTTVITAGLKAGDLVALRDPLGGAPGSGAASGAGANPASAQRTGTITVGRGGAGHLP